MAPRSTNLMERRRGLQEICVAVEKAVKRENRYELEKYLFG